MTMPRAPALDVGRVKVALVPDDRVSERSLDVGSAVAVPAQQNKMQRLMRPWCASFCRRERLQLFIAGSFWIEALN